MAWTGGASFHGSRLSLEQEVEIMDREQLPRISNEGTWLAHCDGCGWMPAIDGHAPECAHTAATHEQQQPGASRRAGG